MLLTVLRSRRRSAGVGGLKLLRAAIPRVASCRRRATPRRVVADPFSEARLGAARCQMPRMDASAVLQAFWADSLHMPAVIL